MLGVATAIILGLGASFIQSLGLTIQRKSHLLNESLPPLRRRTEWKRPLWLFGFIIFLTANIGGTVFQIGALPIVMLAPLGAVSLLYNAVLARFLLNDLLSKYMIMGTGLIATGAVLIGYFGVVPSPPHDLDELLDLYGRPSFVAFATIFTFLFIGVLTVSHLAEWQLHTRMYRSSLPARPPKPKHHRTGGGARNKLRRRWSAPTLAPVEEVSESNSGIATPVLAIQDEAARRGMLRFTASPQQQQPQQHGAVFGRTIVPVSAAHGPPVSANIQNGSSKRDYGSLGRSEFNSSRKRKKGYEVPRLELREAEQRMDAETVKRSKLGLAVAYGGASGTLSGACLLLAKSGVELLMLTFSGNNQFGRWQSWFLISVLLSAALLQLWYLNKALKLADPTLVCPLAFCFYNTSSIALGLVYFDQLGALAWYDLLLVAVGTAVLLAGVWTVSLHGNEDDNADDAEADYEPLMMSPASYSSDSRGTSMEEYESLLAANGAGITGPHLPLQSDAISPHSSSFVEQNPISLGSPEEAPLTLPLAGSVPPKQRQASSSSNGPVSGSPGSPTRKRRSGSASHQRRPTITLDFPLRDDLLSSPLSADLESTVSHMSPKSPDDPSAKRSPSLYNTLLGHGLSIGISPSSPGFHLQPRSPSLSRAHSSWKRPGGHGARSMSEADAPSTHNRPRGEHSRESSSNSNEAEQTGEGAVEANTSGFAVMLDSLDLNRRLQAIGFGTAARKGRGWWKKLRSRSGEREPLLEEREEDESSVIITSNSNGSLQAAIAPDMADSNQNAHKNKNAAKTGLGLNLS